MVVEDFYPVVVLDSYVQGILVVYPERLDAPRQSKHAMVVVVGGVDVPLPVGRDVVQHDSLALAVGLALNQVTEDPGVRLRLVSGQMLAEGDIPFMVEIEVLPPGKGPPGDQLLHVHAEGSV